MDQGNERIQDVANQAGEAASNIVGSIRDQAGRYAEQAQDYAKQGYDVAAEQTRNAKSATEQYVKDNPWYAVAITLGVGILIGLSTRSSR